MCLLAAIIALATVLSFRNEGQRMGRSINSITQPRCMEVNCIAKYFEVRIDGEHVYPRMLLQSVRRFGRTTKQIIRLKRFEKTAVVHEQHFILSNVQ